MTMISYQPDIEIVEKAKIDGWQILPATRDAFSCGDATRAWISVLAKAAVLQDGKDERTLKQKFLDQAQKWGDETRHLSSPGQKMLHPSYQAILGMGQEHKDEIIDLLIQDMKDNRRQWFWALSYLAQANPIKPEDAGRIDRMINAWVRWAEMRARA
jgi:hypothetical protein